MEYLYMYENTRKIIEKYNFVFKKKFGQNFLTDKGILDCIVSGANITKDDVVLEIGPGIGTLTQLLAEKAGKVIAVEIDKDLIHILSNETLKEFDNVEIINNDIMKMNLKELANEKGNGKKLKVVANLPYYITTPIIMMLLESGAPIESITIMIQKEVAERLASTNLDKEYGAITVAVQYHSEVKIVCEVSREYFVPSPNVDSAVVNMKILEDKRLEVKNEQLFFKLVKVAFGQRRKTLLNCIMNQTNLFRNKEEVIDVFEKLGIAHDIRGEKLSIEQFRDLADEIDGGR